MQVISRPVHAGGRTTHHIRACGTAAGTNASAILRKATETAKAKMLFISFVISGVIRDN